MSLSLDPQIGSELFGYRLEALLGRGGMSAVYRAHDLALDRKVALKILTPELAGDDRFRSRFLRESRVAASLDHPNVIPVYEAGESEGLLCIAMRYVEGTDLKRLLREGGPLEPAQAIAWCAQVAAALDAAHEHGLVHRDVKPSNVLITQGGHCYLADFGITRDTADRSDLTLTGQLVGSVDYAAPEQIEGKPVDGRADVYSLGCLLYECLTGSVPFPKDSDLAVLWAHVNEPPPRLDAHSTLGPVMRRALAKNPGDRYQTCGALVDAAQAALPKPEPRPPRRRYLLGALATIVLAGGLAAGLAFALTDGAGRAKPNLTVRNNTLVRIDPRTNKITAVTPAGVAGAPLPAAGDVAAGRGRVWVYNWSDNTVRAVDSRTNTVERVAAIGGLVTVLHANSIAADAGGAWVLSSEAGSGVLTRVQPGLTYSRKTILGYHPLAVAAGAGAVWVAAKNATNVVILRVDPTTGSILRTVRLTGGDVQSIAVGDGAVWVLQSGTISRLDPTTGRLTSRLRVRGWNVGQIAAGSAGVWATMQPPDGPNLLVNVDPRARRLLKTIPAPSPGPPSGTLLTRLALGDDAVWWNGATGTIWRVDPKTYKIVQAIHVTPPPNFPADFTPLGIATGAGAVWVTVTIGP